ncbi:helix-turn-helix domain-containing protein [Microbulbifer sp.]|uniref:helix-turn-helix domain-containing protein n=1 Tax=Microbulbifer sp. TaxID=1908541 RepID=UPI003F330A97
MTSSSCRRYRQGRVAVPAFDLLKQQEDILLNRFGGSREKIAIKPGRASGAKKKKPPTRLATKEMLEEKLSLQEIADRRGLTLGTILSHLEKLKGSNQLPDIEYLKASLSENDIATILAAFKKSEDGTLTPIHREFDGKYSFEDLRLARLFAW